MGEEEDDDDDDADENGDNVDDEFEVVLSAYLEGRNLKITTAEDC